MVASGTTCITGQSKHNQNPRMEVDDEPREFAMISKLFRIFNRRWHLLKKEDVCQHVGSYAERNEAGYTVTIINRGEQLLYTDENGSLVLEISIHGGWVDASSISKWDRGGNVSEQQRVVVISRVKQYFVTYQSYNINIINSDKVEV